MTVKPTISDSEFFKPRYDDGGKIRFMTRSDGYVMVRRPGCTPFVKTYAEWEALPTAPPT